MIGILGGMGTQAGLDFCNKLAKLNKGKVDQKSQVALNNRQINDGYVILCVARAKTDCTFDIGVESHDKLYRNPFIDPLAPHELKADIATIRELKDD